MNDQDLNMRAMQLQNDRGYEGMNMNQNNGQQQMNQNNGQQQMNPQMMQYLMSNPQMMQQMMQMMSGNNNTNFLMGGGKGESAKLHKGITAIKNRFAEDLNLDPQLLANMSPDEITQLIKKNKKITKNITISDSEENSDSDDNESKKSKKIKKAKKKKDIDAADLVKQLIEAKKNIKKSKKDLDSAVDSVKNKKKGRGRISESSDSSKSSKGSSDNSSDESTESNKKKRRDEKKIFTKVVPKPKEKNKLREKDYKKKKNDSSEESEKSEKIKKSNKKEDKKKDKKSTLNSDEKSIISKPKMIIKKDIKKDVQVISDTQSEELSNNNSNNSNETPDNKKKSEKNKITTQVKLGISDDIKYCSGDTHDFLCDFEDRTFKKGIFENVSNIEIIKSKFPTLSPKITRSCYKMHFICAELDDDKLIEFADGECPPEDFIEAINNGLEELEITCKADKQGWVTFEQKRGYDFIMDCSDNSFSKLLGFDDNEYEGKSKYVSDRANLFNRKFVYLYFKNIIQKPVGKIAYDGTFTQLESSFDIKKLSQIIVQIRNNIINKDDDLYDFNGDSFNITLEIKHEEKEEKEEKKISKYRD